MTTVILIQLFFAAFCFMAAVYIGHLRKAYAAANNAFGQTAQGVHAWLKTSWAFDIAMIGLAVGIAAFLHLWLLCIVLVLIYRLAFTKTVNLIENGSFFFLDVNKRVDRFVRFALMVKVWSRSPAPGLIEVVILAAAIVLLNLLYLI